MGEKLDITRKMPLWVTATWAHNIYLPYRPETPLESKSKDEIRHYIQRFSYFEEYKSIKTPPATSTASVCTLLGVCIGLHNSATGNFIPFLLSSSYTQTTPVKSGELRNASAQAWRERNRKWWDEWTHPGFCQAQHPLQNSLYANNIAQVRELLCWIWAQMWFPLLTGNPTHAHAQCNCKCHIAFFVRLTFQTQYEHVAIQHTEFLTALNRCPNCLNETQCC